MEGFFGIRLSVLGLLAVIAITTSSSQAVVEKSDTEAKSARILLFAPIQDEFVLGHYESKAIVVFKTLKLSWMQADKKCKLHGMELVSFDSKSELGYIEALTRAAATFTTSPNARYKMAWVAASDLFSEGTFTWLNSGKPFWSSYFAPAQPDNAGGNEHCVEIGASGKNISEKFTANDFTCNTLLSVVCQLSFS